MSTNSVRIDSKPNSVRVGPPPNQVKVEPVDVKTIYFFVAPDQVGAVHQGVTR